MKYLLGLFVALIVFASPALGDTMRYGPADHLAVGFQSMRGGTFEQDDVSMVFTPQTTVEVGRVRMITQSGGYGGAPMGHISIHANDASGPPGTLLSDSPEVAIPRNTSFECVLNTPVTLNAGTTYHVRLRAPNVRDYDDVLLIYPNSFRLSRMKAVDERVYDHSSDPTHRGLYYRYVAAPPAPVGWNIGGPGEYGEWDPTFGLYTEGGTPLTESVGADKVLNSDRIKGTTHRLGQSFVLQDVPPECQLDGQVLATSVRMYMYKRGAPTGGLLVKLLDSAGTLLSQGLVDVSTVTSKAWLEIPIPGVGLTVGERYEVVLSGELQTTVNSSNCVGVYYQVTGSAVPIEASWQGTAAYSLMSTDSGTTWTTDTAEDRLIQITIPEPATLGLLAIGLCGLLARRRRN